MLNPSGLATYSWALFCSYLSSFIKYLIRELKDLALNKLTRLSSAKLNYSFPNKRGDMREWG